MSFKISQMPGSRVWNVNMASSCPCKCEKNGCSPFSAPNGLNYSQPLNSKELQVESAILEKDC